MLWLETTAVSRSKQPSVLMRTRSAESLILVSKRNVPWLIPLALWVALLAIVSGVFVASVKNARALKRDLDRRFDAIGAGLEQRANALADELLGSKTETRE